MIVGTFTNLSVCWVVVRNSQARTARNLFIINMAISDLTVCFITMPFTMLRLINQTWPYGEALCRLTRYTLSGLSQKLACIQFTYLYSTIVHI